MRVKIQKSMLLVLCITLLTTFSLLIAATYFQSLNNMKAELKQEAVYIQTAINIRDKVSGRYGCGTGEDEADSD